MSDAAQQEAKNNLIEEIVQYINNDEEEKALKVLANYTPTQVTQLVREASNWAFRLDLQERIEQVRAQELGMLEDDEVMKH
mmetsp:Transcript_16704/g.38128  ORF Transcript_16704/g.38128 Transcript_16704/m.38128 type:complete len:81 (+) Transcript_16704:282-524(+)